MKNCMVQTCPVLLLVLFHSSWPTFKTEGKKTKQKKTTYAQKSGKQK